MREGREYGARWRDAEGSQKSRSFIRKVDGDRFARRMEYDINVGGYVDPHAGKVSVRTYAEEWRKAQLQHSESTVRDVELSLRVHLYPALGGRPIASARPTELQGWVAGVTKTLAPSTLPK